MKKLVIALLVMCNTVISVSAATVSERLDALETALPELESLCALLEEYDIPCDYEKLDAEIISRYIKYGREDIANKRSERAEYTVEILEKLYKDAKVNLSEVIDGNKTPVSVPVFKSGTVTTDGVNHIANVEGGENKPQPVFLSGYGHFFGEMSTELPNFSEMGVNFVQVPIPANATVLRPDYFVPGWQFEKSGSTTIGSSDIRKNGSWGAEIKGASGGKGRVYQTVSTTAGSNYTFSVWIKTDKVSKAQIKYGNTVIQEIATGTVDWTQYSIVFTAASDTTEIGVYTEGGGTLWLDGAVLSGTSANHLKNENFEETATMYNGYYVSDSAVKERVTNILQTAQDNNVMVTFNLEPHNMPEWLTDSAQPGYDSKASSSGQLGFLKYNIGNQTFKDILKAHIQAVATATKGFTSLHSITLSNEGIYRINVNTNTKNSFLSGYREWLEDKYGSISKVKEAWGKSFMLGFNFISFPDDATAATVESMDYNAYNAEVFMSWHEWMDAELKAINPDIKTHAKFLIGYMLSNRLGDGIDYERIANSLDYIGFDGGTSLEGLDTDMRLIEDIMSSCCEGKPLVNSETHTIPDTGETAEYYGPEQSAVTTLELIQGYIHGRTASALWVWRRHYQWPEYLESMGFRADAVRNISKATYDINRNADKLTALQNAEKNIYMLWSPVAQRYNNDDYIACLKDAYNAALQTGQRVSFVTEKQLASGKLTGSEILVLTKATHLMADSYNHLRTFANKGGKIIAIGTNLTHNELKKTVSSTDILQNAVKLSASADKALISDALQAACEEKGITLVFPTDSDGNIIDGIEARFAETDDGVLVNLANYTRADMNLSLYSNKYNLKYAKDLFTGEIINTDDMKLSQLETHMLFFPNKYENADVQILPSDSAVTFSWNAYPDNPLNPKEKMQIMVNGEVVSVADYNAFTCTVGNLTNSEVYVVEVAPVYKDGKTGTGVKMMTSPHSGSGEVVVDDKGNGKYIITNMTDSEKSVTAECTDTNGKTVKMNIRLKAGEATEVETIMNGTVNKK